MLCSFSSLKVSYSAENLFFFSGWYGVQQQSSQFQTNLGGNLFSSGGLSGGLNTLPTPQPVDNQSFQLQKPPPGNKRGKR
jgi:hypothetical protein